MGDEEASMREPRMGPIKPEAMTASTRNSLVGGPIEKGLTTPVSIIYSASK